MNTVDIERLQEECQGELTAARAYYEDAEAMKKDADAMFDECEKLLEGTRQNVREGGFIVVALFLLLGAQVFMTWLAP